MTRFKFNDEFIERLNEVTGGFADLILAVVAGLVWLVILGGLRIVL